MATRDEIVSFLDETLEIAAVEDDALNGLQVQGEPEVRRVALATDAALAVYRRAADLGCEMVVVHHGIIWAKPAAIRGVLHDHVSFLIDEGMSLYAAHLPLDLHSTLGNNAILARLAGIVETHPFGVYHGRPIGFSGELQAPLGVEDLAAIWRKELGASPVILPFGPREVRSVGIVSGGGSFCLTEAVDAGLDCFVTGEGEHSNHHFALEAGIHVIYLGHYHSETPGVRALGDRLAERFGLETNFIDVPTII